VKGNAMTTLSVYAATATTKGASYTGKASLQDITDPLNPISLGGNLTLKVDMTDNGEPGNTDKLAINVWDNAGGLFYSSNWNGTQTIQQTIAAGNIRITGGNTTSTVSKNTEIGVATLELNVAPNPVDDQLNVALTGWNDSQEVRIIMTDLLMRNFGTWDVSLEKGTSVKAIDMSAYPAGTYILTVQSLQNESLLSRKVVKN
jgi:hypothetical protein